jgi:hypothetical protein
MLKTTAIEATKTSVTLTLTIITKSFAKKSKTVNEGNSISGHNKGKLSLA